LSYSKNDSEFTPAFREKINLGSTPISKIHLDTAGVH